MSVRVRLVVDKVALGQVFLPLIWFSPVIVTSSNAIQQKQNP